jgi:hypothetical protein
VSRHNQFTLRERNGDGISNTWPRSSASTSLTLVSNRLSPAVAIVFRELLLRCALADVLADEQHVSAGALHLPQHGGMAGMT